MTSPMHSDDRALRSGERLEIFLIVASVIVSLLLLNRGTGFMDDVSIRTGGGPVPPINWCDVLIGGTGLLLDAWWILTIIRRRSVRASQDRHPSNQSR